jgi:hypothetical protein
MGSKSGNGPERVVLMPSNGQRPVGADDFKASVGVASVWLTLYLLVFFASLAMPELPRTLAWAGIYGEEAPGGKAVPF